jgi:hypothetical protein
MAIFKIPLIEERILLTINLMLGLCDIIFNGLNILITLIILINPNEDSIILKSKIPNITIIKSRRDQGSLK